LRDRPAANAIAIEKIPNAGWDHIGSCLPARFRRSGEEMITCHVRYEIDPEKMAEFEEYSRMWIELTPRFGGTHHGYFLPAEGRSDIAFSIFSFPTLSDYDKYRHSIASDPDVLEARAFAKRTRCFLRTERSFFRPLLPVD
jgi:hypothetical protein